MKITSREAYKSIDDLPIYNWFKIFDTSDYQYLVIKGKFSKEELEWQWEVIFDEFIKTFGVSSEFRRIFNLRKKIALLEYEYALSRKKWIENKIKIAKDELSKINPTKQENSNYMKIVVQVEKHLGHTIKENETSVLKFYTYLKELENDKAA